MINKLENAYNQAVTDLKNANVPDYIFDVNILFEEAFGLKKINLYMSDISSVTQKELDLFNNMVEKRCLRTPLQYILGKWDFYNLEFFVGDGVLIPRQDTEILCETIINTHFDTPPTVIDLCSGSGCVGMTIERNLSTKKTILVEYSQKAFSYLEKNLLHNGSNCTPILGDIFKVVNDFENNFFDVVVSNPPYIQTSVMLSLSDEVKKEPSLALDGGDTGLYFYENITKLYYPKIKKDGYLFFEIGFDQGESVSNILKSAGFTGVSVLNDYGNNPRVVFGKK